MVSIFLSHNSNDKPFVRKLSNELEKEGIKTWADEAEMLVGDSLISKISDGIKQSDYLGVVLSENSVSSSWVQLEVKIALSEEINGGKIKVLPMLLSKCTIPAYLSDKIYADFSDNHSSGLNALLNRLKSGLPENLIKERRVVQIINEAFTDWETFDHSRNFLLKDDKIKLITSFQLNVSFPEKVVEYLVLSFSYYLATSPTHFEEISRFMLNLKNRDILGSVFKRLLDKTQSVLPAVFQIGLSINDMEIDRIIKGRLQFENDSLSREIILKDFALRNIPVEKETLKYILDTDSNWVTKTYALKHLNEKNNCLFFDDGTLFSKQIQEIFSGLGYKVNVHTWGIFSNISLATKDILQFYEIVVVVKGEHFMQNENNFFYNTLKNYVSSGGVLLTTSWVSWENYTNPEFNQMLPFRHEHGRFIENSSLNLQSLDSDVTIEGVVTSFELLYPKPESTVLLKSRDGIAILGYKHYNKGISVYLNSCQHACYANMPSPFTYSGKFYDLVKSSVASILLENKST